VVAGAPVLGLGTVLLRPDRQSSQHTPRTTKLYDRTTDEITLDEIERIAI